MAVYSYGIVAGLVAGGMFGYLLGRWRGYELGMLDRETALRRRDDEWLDVLADFIAGGTDDIPTS